MIFLAFLYAAFILFCLFSWLKLKYRLPAKNNLNKLSVIISVRNEEVNIKHLFESLNRQVFNKDFFEVIIVDDHSTDGTLHLLNEFKNKFDLNIAVYSLEKELFGKKAAIHFAIDKAVNNLIVTTDADCIAGPEWLSSIQKNFDPQQHQMLVMPVAIRDSDFFSSLQALEFLSLQAVTASFIRAGYPILCNGANIAFVKGAYKAVYEDICGKKMLSGDDTFLMFAISSRFGRKSIGYLKNCDALILTVHSKTINSFFQQRTRWAGKVKSYNKPLISIIGLFITVVNIALLMGFIFSIFYPVYQKPLFTLLITKLIADFVYLFSFSTFTKQERLLQYYFFVQFLNPLYIIVVAALAIFQPISWKERNLNRSHSKTATL